MKRFLTDLLLGVIIAVGLFILYKTQIKPRITTVISTGMIIFAVGFCLFWLFKRGSLLRRLAGIATISGGVLAIGVYVMVLSALSRM